MKEKILQLRKEGKSYNQISKLLGCSKSTISYHCGSEESRSKSKARSKLWRKEKNYKPKNKYIASFKSRINSRIYSFCKKDRQGKKNLSLPILFTYDDVINKFGIQTKCALTGISINLHNYKDYDFDHIIPVCRGGTNDINNLQILSRKVNQLKSYLTNEEFIELCKSVTDYNK